MQKLIIVTAPSGAGKTTIVRHLLSQYDELAFSVSATNRKKRKHEKNGMDYYFLTTRNFKKKVKSGAFAEWEEVYRNQFYGTLKSEIDRLFNLGKNIIFDIDVQGAFSLSELYADRCLTVFIKPPSLDVLLERLKNRKTETPESLKRRIDKATIELTYADKFDKTLINDDLDIALEEAEAIIKRFLYNK